MSDPEITTFGFPGQEIVHICKEVEGTESICGEDCSERDLIPITERRSLFWDHITTTDYMLCESCKFKHITEWSQTE